MRDNRWRYTIKHYGRHGQLVLETTHGTEASRDAEIEASRARLRRHELARIEVISHVEPYGIETIYQ